MSFLSCLSSVELIGAVWGLCEVKHMLVVDCGVDNDVRVTI